MVRASKESRSQLKSLAYSNADLLMNMVGSQDDGPYDGIRVGAYGACNGAVTVSARFPTVELEALLGFVERVPVVTYRAKLLNTIKFLRSLKVWFCITIRDRPPCISRTPDPVSEV